MSGTTPGPFNSLSTAARVSNLVVQVMRAYTGRGPTKAWTSINGELVGSCCRTL